jgi:uncharacterized MAPEG superfamily protein
MTPLILAVLTLWFIQSLIPASIQYMQSREHLAENLGIALRGRDNPPQMPLVGGRAQRAFRNLAEALVVFLPVALLIELRGEPEALALQAGWAFLALRVLYLPAYLSAVTGLRSTVWMGSVAALLVMASTLL